MKPSESRFLIKPCPFCGHDAELYFVGGKYAAIRCSNRACGTEQPVWRNEKDAVRHWNERAEKQIKEECTGIKVNLQKNDEMRKIIAETDILKFLKCPKYENCDWKNCFDCNESRCINLNNVNDLPFVTPQSRKGHWITTNEYITTAYSSIYYVECSCCHNNSLEEGDYCPNCGAEMSETIRNE